MCKLTLRVPEVRSTTFASSHSNGLWVRWWTTQPLLCWCRFLTLSCAHFASHSSSCSVGASLMSAGKPRFASSHLTAMQTRFSFCRRHAHLTCISNRKPIPNLLATSC